MSSLGSPNPFFIAGKKAYEIERSLRFNDDDSPNLARTPSGDGNKKKWTWSSWIKISANGTLQTLFSVRSGNRQSTIFLKANGQLQYFSEDSGGTTQANLKTDALLRDPSAWYHVVVYLDAANTTGKIYLNGVEQTLEVSTAVVNTDHNFNTTLEHLIGNEPSQSNYFDGYMAEINFIDGQAYDPSYFGQTDVLTGQWNPKKYTGSYGTNGFYLNFSDNSGTSATTLGKDSSGNSNNFTPSNFAVSDAVKDSPTNNFATLNSITGGSGVTYSEGNLKFANAAGNSGSGFSTIEVKSGKWYCEALPISSGTSSAYPFFGIQNRVTGNYTTYYSDGEKYTGGSNSAYGASYTLGDIIGIAYDADSGNITFYKNGASQGTFDSSRGGETIAFYFTDGSSLYTFSGAVNFGQDSSFAGQKTAQGNADGSGQGDFYYSPPSGYKALCSANLPDPAIKLPNQHFNTLLYTGNDSSDRDITGVGFQPDWLWIKNRSQADWHITQDALRGANKILYSNQTSGENTDNSNGHVNSFLADGFNVDAGASGNVNENNENYVAWNWNAGDTDGKTYTVKVVDDSGNKYRFDDFGTSAVTLDLAEGGTYIFDQSDSSNATHPLRFYTAADKTGGEYTTGVTTSGTAGSSGATVTITIAASAPTLYYQCSSHAGMGGQINTKSTLGSSNFDGTIQNTVKANATAGFSIVTWTGNGSSGSTLGHGLGVAPKAIITKQRNSSGSWATFHNALGTGSEVYLDLSQQATSSNFWVSSPTSSVFTVSGSDYVNENTSTYVGYCFSEVAGYSKFGKYTGNGSTDGTFVFTGFKVQFLLIKKTNTTESWILADTKRNSITGRESPADSYLLADQANAESTGIIYDMLSNGFKFRSTSQNTSGHTYIYLAFSESPFKYARAS